MKSRNYVLLSAIAGGLGLGFFVTYAALLHNPQGEFRDTLNGQLQLADLSLVFLMWFVAGFLGVGGLALIVKKLAKISESL